MANHATVEQVIDLARQLSPLEKLKLIEQLTPDLQAALNSTATPTPKQSLRGILKGCNIGDEEIQQARREMWGNFPREVH